MSLVRLLGNIKLEEYRSYFTIANGWNAAGYYYTFSVDADNVRQLLDINPATQQPATLHEKQSAITAQDPIYARKNAFHVLFSVPAIIKDSLPGKNYYLPVEYKNTMSSSLMPNLNDKNYEARTRRYGHHTSVMSQVKLELVSPNLIQKKKRLNAKNILHVLLDPFTNKDQEDHDRALTSALLPKDRQDNTPLYYAWQKLVDMDFSLLQQRITALHNNYKTKLLCEPNQNGKTLLHLIVTTPSSREDLNIFGVDAISRTLACRDHNHNTPWHDAFRTAPLETIQYLYLLLPYVTLNNAAEVKEEKHAEPIDYLFGQNKEGLNPLHFLCQRDSSTPEKREENVRILQTSFDLPPHDLWKDCIHQPDKNGLTPLNYAIHSGNFPLAQEILRRLEHAEQKKALAHKHNANHYVSYTNESMLHYICQYGNPDLLQQAVEILGPDEVYRINQECPIKYVANPYLSENIFNQCINQNKENSLFHCFEYFVTKYNDKIALDAQGSDFTSRFQDFCNCLAAIQNDALLPTEAGQFQKKIALFGRESDYKKLRNALSAVTPENYRQFRAFIWGTAGSSQKSAVLAQHIVEGWAKAQNANESKLENPVPEPSAPPAAAPAPQLPYNPLSLGPPASAPSYALLQASSMWEHVPPPLNLAPNHDPDAQPPVYTDDDVPNSALSVKFHLGR